MTNDISPILESLGFQKSEIKTYMAALKLGPSTVIALAKAINLSRQATYLAIEALTNRGVMSSVQRGKKNYYASEPPSKLVTYAKRYELEVKEKIADLERQTPLLELQMGGERPVVKVFEGKAGVKEILEEVVATKAKEAWEITDGNAMLKILSREDLESLRKNLLRIGTRVHGLYPVASTETQVDVNHVAIGSEYEGFHSNIGIYGNKLALITFEGKMHSVLIESPVLTKTMKILFELAFAGAKKQKSQ
jgi:sugar-specific transcriptional regulator TrmB